MKVYAMKTKYLIVGAGPASMSAAAAIRRIGSKAEIVMATKEDCTPYSPAALPYLFNGEMTDDLFFACGKRRLADLDVRFLSGYEAVGLDPAGHSVTFANGETVEYEKLLIATGARPATTPIKGVDDSETKGFRTYRDYVALKESGKRVAIHGGGLVAVELAEKLGSAGVDTSVIVRSRLLRRYFDPELAGKVADILSAHGVRVYSGTPIDSVSNHSGAYEIRLGDGRLVNADVIVSATGVTARIPFGGLPATAAGGIKADATMRTNLEDVYAAGDVAAAPSFFTGDPEICPILTEAIEQGRVAGLNMAGEAEQYRGGIPANMLRCRDEYFFSAGVTDETTVEGSEAYASGEKNAWFKLVVKNGAVIGVEAWNRPELSAGVFRYLIYEAVPVGAVLDILREAPDKAAKALMSRHRAHKATALISTR